MKTLLISFLFIMTSCSVYQSQGRKDFEKDIPSSKAQAAGIISYEDKTNNKTQHFHLENCKPVSEFEAWLKFDHLPENSELIHLQPEIEIWKVQQTEDLFAFRVLYSNKNNDLYQCSTTVHKNALTSGLERHLIQSFIKDFLAL